MLDYFCFFFFLSSVPVADIKALLTGKDCPHMKDNKGKQTKVHLKVPSPEICF